jgi:hypothetical protein
MLRALQDMADFDGALWGEAGVGVDEFVDLGQGAGEGGDDRFAAARPFVDVIAAFGADAEFGRRKALFAAEAFEAFGLGLGRDVALHRGGVGAQGAGAAAEQFDHRLALLASVQIPKRGI